MLEVIDIVKKLIPVNDHWDHFAKTAVDITLDYGYITENDEEVIQLLNGIKSITTNVTINDDIENHIKFFSERISNGNYWCAEGYFSLPKHIFDALEKARKAVRRKKYQEAKTILESLLTQTTNPLSQSQIKIVNTSLAHCLNLQAVEFLYQANRYLERVPGFVQKVSERYSYAKERINLAGWAAENYKLSQACYEGLLYCMACGKYIGYTSDIGTFKYDNVYYVGCPSCIREHNIELESNKNNFITHVRASLNFTVRANQLNPNNKIIKGNLELITPIAKKLGISTNTKSVSPTVAVGQNKNLTSLKAKSNANQSQSYLAPQKTNKSAKSSSNNKSSDNTTLLVIIGVAIVICLCVIISSGF